MLKALESRRYFSTITAFIIVLFGLSQPTCADWYKEIDFQFDNNRENNDRATQHALFNQTKKPTQSIGPFSIGSFINIDMKPKTMQKTLPGEGEDYIALSNAGIISELQLLSFLNTHIGLVYYKANKGQGDRNEQTGGMLDEGYITLADFNRYPFFVQAGRFYLPFGRYDRYAISPTLVQMLTSARATGLEAGFIDAYGFSGSIYLAQGFVTKDPKKIQGDLNGGVALYINQNFNTDYNIAVNGGIQYMYNMLHANAFAQGGIYQLNTSNAKRNVYLQRTDGMALQIGTSVEFVDVFFNYVTALKRTRDLVRLRTIPTNSTTAILGAKPSAWEAGFKVNFLIHEMKSAVDFTFQRSREAAGLYVFNSLPTVSSPHPFPQTRYILGATFHVTKYAFVRLQWGHNFLYKQGQGDNGTQGDDATIRVGAFI